jgi:hypothetical protein
VFVKSTMQVTTLLAKDETALHLHSEFHAIYMKVNFIAVRPADGDSRSVWIGHAKSNPNCNPERLNCVLIQYFQPTSRSQVIQETYRGWNSEVGSRWKIEDSNGQ